MKAPAMPPPPAPMRARSNTVRFFSKIWVLGRVLGRELENQFGEGEVVVDVVEAKNGMWFWVGVREDWEFGVMK